MFIVVNGIKLFYKRNGSGGMPCVLLHGWGASSELTDGIYDFLTAKDIGAISLDLPAFGQSGRPPSNWGVYEYANLVKDFLSALDVGRCNLVGHSFGGRLAIILAAKTHLCENIVLVDAAGLRPRHGAAYYFKVAAYKLRKRLGLRTLSYGSDDYRALDDELRPVFTRVVNTHLDGLLKDIKCPALIVWGENDTETPLYIAKRLERKLADSALVVLKGCGHYSYLERPVEFNLILYSLIKNK